MNKISLLKLLTLIATELLIASTLSYALAGENVQFEAVAKIESEALKFLENTPSNNTGSNLEVEIKRLDPRLKLRKCSNQLNAFFPSGSKRTGKVTVAVSCSSPVVWKVFVSASIYEYAKVVVAKKTLSKNLIISSADIVLEKVNVSNLRRTPIFVESDAIGSTPKRTIRAGSIIYENGICMVCRGDYVQVIAKNQYFDINMEAIALEDASIGQMTQVRNKESKRSFNARVVGRNQLEVVLTR
jgi:flagella basal body P-ring formation protein FlgA